MKRRAILAGLLLAAALPMTAAAGEWKQDKAGWWYQEDNGSYPVNCWKEVNGKWYYFGANGYMLENTTTPDGYQVGADGAWVQSAKTAQASAASSKYLSALTTALPTFSAEFRNQVNQMVPVKIEANDGYYLWCREDKIPDYNAGGKNRKDYSNDTLYLAVRDYIVQEVLKGNGTLNSVEIPIRFFSHNQEEDNYFNEMITNLEIDLNKSGVCKNSTFFLGAIPSDGAAHLFDRSEAKFFCDVQNGLDANFLIEYNKEGLAIRQESLNGKQHNIHPGWGNLAIVK